VPVVAVEAKMEVVRAMNPVDNFDNTFNVFGLR
jgi:hypothetical protein